jgi:predicted dehydrogenase
MFDSGFCDAVIITTPHYWHAPIAIRAARAGLHILCEKPLAAAIGPARAMVRECDRCGVSLGVMFQHRTRGIMRKMKEMIEGGVIGKVHRISMICSNWYRPQAYYDSGAWRGTWDGEGGGVLLNQAPHHLDLFQWLVGMPSALTAFLDTRLHKIEVENTANVICHYDDGKTGYIYATTAEAPGMEQLTVCGDKGTLVAEGKSLRLGKLAMPLPKHLVAAKGEFDHIACAWHEVRHSRTGGKHMDVIRAFLEHIHCGKPMVASGKEALNQLELTNAMYLSGYEKRTVAMPIDAREVDRLLARLEKQRSTGRGGGQRRASDRELAGLLKKKR